MTATVRDNFGQSRYEIHDGRPLTGLPEHGITGRKTTSASTAFTQALALAQGSR